MNKSLFVLSMHLGYAGGILEVTLALLELGTLTHQ